MQLDPGPSRSAPIRSASSVSGGGNKVRRSIPSYERPPSKRRRSGGRVAMVLGAFLLTFVLTNVLLYEELTTAVTTAKGYHKVIAKHVRKGIETAIRTGTGLATSATAHLPHPQLLRWSSLPTLEEIVGPDSEDPPVSHFDGVDLDASLAAVRKEVPKYLKEPSLELHKPQQTVTQPQGGSTASEQKKVPKEKLHKQKEKAMEKLQEVQQRSRKQEEPQAKEVQGPKKPGNVGLVRDNTHHADAPRLGETALNTINVNSRVQSLLQKEVDITLNGILLEMKGTISCGGHLIMEFKDFEELAGTSADLPSVIPETDPLGAKNWGTCAVVGNSGTLLSHSHGAAIDQHDTVIRFNRAPTRSFEDRVGSKTTVRLQNVDNLGYREKASDKYLLFSARSKHDLTNFVRHRRKYPLHNQYAFNPEFWCHVWDWVAHRKLKPSSGMAGVVMALRSCKHPVDLYGFSHNATRFHYFNELPEKVTHEEIYKYHPLVEEAEIYRELEALNMTRVVS